MMEAYGRISSKKKQKKSEEERLAKELKAIKLQRQYLNASKAMVEEKAWKDLASGAERQVDYGQNQKLIDQYKVNKIKLKDTGIRANNNRTEVQKKIQTDDNYQTLLQTKKMENDVLHEQVTHYKQSKFQSQKNQEGTVKNTELQKNPFKEKINQMARDKRHKADLKKTKNAMRTNTDFERTEGLDETYQPILEAQLEEEEAGMGEDMMGEDGQLQDEFQDKLEVEA